MIILTRKLEQRRLAPVTRPEASGIHRRYEVIHGAGAQKLSKLHQAVEPQREKETDDGMTPLLPFRLLSVSIGHPCKLF